MRELPALPSSWGCAREGRVGSGGRVAPESPNFGVAEIGTLAIQIMRGGTLQNWPCYKGIYSEKFPYNTVGFCAQIVGAVI